MAARTVTSVLAPTGPARILLAALRRGCAASTLQHPAILGAADWEAVVSLALNHGVAPLLHQVLKDAGALDSLPPKSRENLMNERRTTAMRNLRHYAEFARVSHAMAERGIPLMALKGLHLAELVYGDISLRPMADLDILVPRARVAEASAALQALDYKADTNFSIASDVIVESKFNLGFSHCKYDVYTELHWGISGPGDVYQAPMEEIWRAAVPARLGGIDTLVMSPAFVLLYICAHLACNHAFAFDLRAIMDIAEIVRAYPQLDWSAFSDHANRHGWRRGIAAALLLAREHVGVPIPDEVLATVGAHAPDPALLADALDELIGSPQLPRDLIRAPNVMSLATLGVAGRLATILRRIFVARTELALLYSVRRDSPRLPFFYAVRLHDLLRKYMASTWVLRGSHPELSETVARRARLAKWISGG